MTCLLAITVTILHYISAKLTSFINPKVAITSILQSPLRPSANVWALLCLLTTSSICCYLWLQPLLPFTMSFNIVKPEQSQLYPLCKLVLIHQATLQERPKSHLEHCNLLQLAAIKLATMQCNVMHCRAVLVGAQKLLYLGQVRAVVPH